MDAFREEFEKQAAALVQLIRNMIDAGQTREAGELLEQYALLSPADPQIAELRGIIAAAAASAASADGVPGAAVAASAVTAPDKLPANELSPGAPPFLENVETVYVMQSIIAKRMGIPNSVFGKMKLMEERLGYRSCALLTTTHDIDLRRTESWLKSFHGNCEIATQNAVILNIYEYFQRSYAQGLKNKAVYSRDGSADGLRYVRASENSFGVYDGAALVRIDIYSGMNGSLRMERHFENGKRVKDIYYDDWGYLNNICEYGADNENDCTVKYFTTDGALCIEAIYGTDSASGPPCSLTVYNETGGAAARLHSDEELTALYLSKVMRDDRFYLLVFEAVVRANIAGLLDRSRKNFALAAVAHNIFLIDPYEHTSGPTPEFEYLYKNPADFDGIVFLTESAREDFKKACGDSVSTFSISHPYYHAIEKAKFERRDHCKAVIVARLFPQKRTDIAVEIFCIVARALPEAKLEIYGTGGDEQMLAARIKALGMENNIFLMGYTDDAISIYRNAAMFMMTSAAEGFPLTLMESVCNGCPAFAFDIKYGPPDVIKDGETGFLFARGDIEGFAGKIIEYFNDLDMQRTMSENCYADAARFGTEAFLEKWTGMAEAVYKGKVES